MTAVSAGRVCVQRSRPAGGEFPSESDCMKLHKEMNVSIHD